MHDVNSTCVQKLNDKICIDDKYELNIGDPPDTKILLLNCNFVNNNNNNNNNINNDVDQIWHHYYLKSHSNALTLNIILSSWLKSQNHIQHPHN